MSDQIDRNIDIRQLRYFLAVAEELSFRRAAERLHITQPPLSRQIAALEASLGVQLFERSGQATQLTAAGRLAQQEFARAVQVFEKALVQISNAGATRRSTLRFGLPWWVDMSKFARFELPLRKATGLKIIEPVLANSPDLALRVLHGELDAALITMPMELQGLTSVQVARLQHMAMIPAAGPLARKRALHLRDLESLPAFLRFKKHENPALWAHFQRLYDAAGFKPARELHAPSGPATIAHIAAGRGCTVMPAAFTRQKVPGVVARRLLDAVYVDVHLVFGEQLEAELVAALKKHARLLEAALN